MARVLTALHCTALHCTELKCNVFAGAPPQQMLLPMPLHLFVLNPRQAFGPQAPLEHFETLLETPASLDAVVPAAAFGVNLRCWCFTPVGGLVSLHPPTDSLVRCHHLHLHRTTCTQPQNTAPPFTALLNKYLPVLPSQVQQGPREHHKPVPTALHYPGIPLFLFLATSGQDSMDQPKAPERGFGLMGHPTIEANMCGDRWPYFLPVSYIYHGHLWLSVVICLRHLAPQQSL